MNESLQQKNTSKKPAQTAEYLLRLIEAHEQSGLSLREVAQACDLDPTYVHYILKGTKRPHRDVFIALGFAYGLERVEVDEILLLAGLPPLGRRVLRKFRKETSQTHHLDNASRP